MVVSGSPRLGKFNGNKTPFLHIIACFTIIGTEYPHSNLILQSFYFNKYKQNITKYWNINGLLYHQVVKI